MSVPTLPVLWLREEQVRNEYDRWRDEGLASGKTAKELRDEFHDGGVRARLGQRFRLLNAFTDEDGNRKLLADGFSRELYDELPAEKKKMLTIEVRVLGDGGKLLRDPMLLSVQHYRLPDGVLVAGRGAGFGVGSRAYNDFLNLLLAEAQDNSGGAHRVLSVVGNTSDFGASGVKSIALSVKGSAPVPVGEPAVPLTHLNYGLTNFGKLLSHDYLRAKVEVLEDGDFALVPSEPLTDALLAYYEGEEFVNACAYDAIVCGLKESWDKHYKKNSEKLTHKLVRRELGKSVGDGWRVKLVELEIFFANPDRKLSCVILDLWGNVLWKRVWDEAQQNKNISPRTLYLLAHNEHIWRINTEAQSLANTGVRQQEVLDEGEGVPTIAPPKPVYRVVPELDEKWELWRLCDSWDDVRKEFLALPEFVEQWEAAQEEKKNSKKPESEDEDEERDHHKPRPPQLTIHYSGNMELLFLKFYNDKDYECEVVVRDETLKELRLTLDEARVRILTFSVEGEPCLVRKPRELSNAAAADATEAAVLENYEKFLPLFASLKTSFLHRDWMSHYSQGLQRAFAQFRRGQLVRNFVEGEHEGVGVDIRSFYASLLASVDKLPVFSPMSDFQPFLPDMELDENCFYIVESRSDEVENFIVLNRKFNMVSGFVLLNCDLPRWNFKVRAFVRPVSLVENKFPLCVEQVAETLGDPLTNTGKFVLNSLIGLTGKRTAQNMEGKWTNCYDEARQRTSDPRDIYAFAEGFLAIARSEEVLLENGFFPAQFLVYDRARLALLRLFRQLKAAGCEVYGVKTDCFIVDKLPADFPLVENGRLVANMGRFHREPEPKLANHDLFHCAQNEDNAPLRLKFSSCREPSDCEMLERFGGSKRELKYPYKEGCEPPPIFVYEKFNYRELTETHKFGGNDLVLVEDGTMVLGACAGSGKTTCCSASCEGKTLVVVPTNKRVDEFETEWLNTQKFRAGELPDFKPKFSDKVSEVVVMTTAQFLGKRISEEGDGEKKTKTSKLPDLHEFNTIFVDEFFQSSSWDIIAIVRRFMNLRAAQTPAGKEEELRAYYDCVLGKESAALKAARTELWDAEGELRMPREVAARKVKEAEDYFKKLVEEREERLKRSPPKREDTLKSMRWELEFQLEKDEKNKFVVRVAELKKELAALETSEKFAKEWARRQREWDEAQLPVSTERVDEARRELELLPTTSARLEAARKNFAEREAGEKTADQWRAELFPSRTKLFANGDTFQLTNHESWNYIGDKQEFCDKFLWRVFPKRIFLRENFRLTDKNERPVLMSILADLKRGQHEDEETGEALEGVREFVLRVLRKNGLGEQVFTNPAEVLRKGKPMPCLAWSNVVGNAINKEFGGEEEVGMLVVCRAYMMKKVKDKETGVVKKVGLRMNKVYKVLDIKDGCYSIKENDAEASKLYPRIKFRRNIAQTAHAVQGETIGENFGIFEFGSNPDWRWLYVALSRASSLKQAWFYDGEPLLKRKELGVRIREKLASYKEQDEKAGRATDKFITEKWVMERFKTQNYCCAEQECMRPLLLEWDETDEEERGQQFSVDRTNNEFGHVLKNCRLTCLRCNLAAASEGK